MHWSLLVPVIAAVLTFLAPVETADAQALDTDGGELTQTYGEGIGRRTWDNRKIHGAIGIKERDRRPFEPDGMRFGNYLVYPSGEVRKVFEDNAYGTVDNRTSDFSVDVRPGLSLRSQFSRHVLNFDFKGRFVEYANEKDLNHVDGFASTDGALHIDHAHTLSFSLASDYRHESRLSFSAPARAREKTPIWKNSAEIGLTRDRGRLATTLGASYTSWDFSDVKAADGSTIDQDGRDVKIYATDLNLKYRFSPGFSAKGRIRGSRTLKRGPDAHRRDAWGYEVVAGLKMETTPLFHWSFLAGVAVNDFDEASLNDASAAIFEVSAKWFVTDRLDLNFRAKRSFDFEELNETSTLTEFTLSADIEALANLIFTFGGSYSIAEGLEDGSKTNRYTALAGMDYMHSKHLHFNLRYDYTLRQSDALEDLYENKIWLGTKLLF